MRIQGSSQNDFLFLQPQSLSGRGCLLSIVSFGSKPSLYCYPPNGSLTLFLSKARIFQTLKYAILYPMRKTSAEWNKWADTFSHFGIEGFVAWLLEIGEPLMLVGAQMLYFGQPLLGHNRIISLANFLEDKEETRAFVAFLRKE